VTPFDFSKVPYQCFGEDPSSYNSDQAQQSHNAYMLIYEKAIKQPMKIVCDKDIVNKIQALPEQLVNQLDCQQSSLGCDSTAITRVSDSIDDRLSTNTSLDSLKETNLDWIPHSFLIYPNIIRRLHANDGISFDEKTKEHYILVPFGDVDKFVPHDLYSQV
jgi:hypothetical protein